MPERNRPPPPAMPPPQLTAEQRAENLVRQAEAAKARMNDVSGTSHTDNIQVCNLGYNAGFENELTRSLMADENFLLVVAHVDDQLKQRIEDGEYIDFNRLIPRDRVFQEEDNHLEMFSKDDHTYWAPARERSNGISSFQCWEQAFRVYSDIYTQAHPTKAAELIQYNHIISTVATTYVWENVYTYNCHFRVHMSRNPNRSWAIILQQVWTMYLKDRNSKGESSIGEVVSVSSEKKFLGDSIGVNVPLELHANSNTGVEYAIDLVMVHIIVGD